MATATVITNLGKSMTVGGLLGNDVEPKFLALGTGAGSRTAAVTDTALTTEIAVVGTNAGTQTTVNVTGDSYEVSQTYTATGSGGIDEAGLCDAASGGDMFLSATFPVVNLLADDTIQVTAEITYA